MQYRLPIDTDWPQEVAATQQTKRQIPEGMRLPEGETLPDGWRILVMSKQLAIASGPGQESALLRRRYDDGTWGGYVLFVGAGSELADFDALAGKGAEVLTPAAREELRKAL